MIKAIVSIPHLERILGYKISEINNIIDNRDKYYYAFYLTKIDDEGNPKKENGKIKKRKIQPSKNELRNIQDIIQTKIFSKIKLQSSIMGGVKGISNIDHAKVHKARKYRFQTDIKKCFPSISSKMIFNSLRSKGFSKKVANILTQLCIHTSSENPNKSYLPQGNPTSPFLANLVMEKIFHRLDWLDEYGIILTTWLDDWTFSSNSDFEDKIPRIIKTINYSGVKIARKKTSYRVNKSVITGVVVGMSTMKVTEKFRKKQNQNLRRTKSLQKSNI